MRNNVIELYTNGDAYEGEMNQGIEARQGEDDVPGSGL